MVSRSMRFHESGVEDNETTDELSRVTPEEVHRPFNYNSDTGVEYRRQEGTGAPPRLLRVSAYCTCESMSLFKLLKWLNRVPTRQLPGGELNPNGWTHKMHMGAIHSSCKASVGHDDDDDDA
ncbi:hypothetical protein DYB31_000841 [Aphanomyces astaci]|uniref:Uncharacterized protein n=1 Tax=Aphanomyces astaci TaxID=112090 RepID=A0A397ENP2_APHAT|nr:hypothetical protein DYB31_000841 [Aphanomyces astaci]